MPTGDKQPLHKLRHSAATRFDTVKATKAQQKAIMGHSPGDVTEGYAHPPLSELRAVLIAAEREMLRWAKESGQVARGTRHKTRDGGSAATDSGKDCTQDAHSMRGSREESHG